MLEKGINIIELPSLQYCTMSAFGGDAWQRKAMSHKSSFIIIDFKTRSHLFLKISRFILGVEQSYFACPSEPICPNWGFYLGFCASAVKKFCKKSLLKICIFGALDF